MKKWLTFLLLLITLTATLFPCCGKDDCCKDELASTTTNHNHQKQEGACSPFITCGTCSGFTQMTQIVELAFFKEDKPVHHSKIISLKLSSYTTSLLQPPKQAS